MKRKTNEMFIQEANKIHKNKYDYSKVEYKNNSTNVCIVCPIHGVFEQRPSNHLNGQGCPKCAIEKATLTKYEFLKRIKEKFGNNLDFSNSNYVNASSLIEVRCNRCGNVFKAKPSALMRDDCLYGCKKCYNNNKRNKIYGVGINDCDGYISVKGEHIYSYKLWKSMIERCYSKKSLKRYKSYQDVFVCKEWLIYSNFKKWYDKHYVKNWHLDKDILVKGNKIYSPDTCCFVPQEINESFVSSKSYRGKYYIGVSWFKPAQKFIAQITIGNKKHCLGYFDNEYNAFLIYKKEKERYIKELADKWKDKIEYKVYKAMYNYIVEITD